MDKLAEAIDDILMENGGSNPVLAASIAGYLCIGEGWLLRFGLARPVHEVHDSCADNGYRRWDLTTEDDSAEG
jgi:hypothetical protein